MSHNIVIIHYLAGLTGLLSGTTALAARKGARLHRQAGDIFIVSMQMMLLSGAYLEYFRSELANTFGSLLAIYLIGSAWITVQRTNNKTGRFEMIMLLLVAIAGIAALHLGLKATATESGRLYGFPSGFYYFYTALSIFCAFLDIKLLIHVFV